MATAIAEKLANQIWDIVREWDYFAKDTVGKQLVCSADSIAADKTPLPHNEQ